MSDLVMPQLSDSMEQGTILSWLKASGDQVEFGDEVLEIETDKATITHTVETAGILEILVEEGATVTIGEPIARIVEPADPQTLPTAQPADSEILVLTESETAPPSPAGTLTAATANAVSDSGSGGGGGGRRRTAATPLARRTAAAHGVTLEGIRGTGPLGRITRADVLGHAGFPPSPAPALAVISTATQPPAPTRTPAAATEQVLSSGTRRQQPSRLQLLIARRMADAKATIPHFQVQAEVAIDRAGALRAELRALGDEDEHPVPTINDIIIKAAALALREHPLANGSYQDDGFILHEAINVGMAVSTDEALVVPTVFDAASKTLGHIARETRALTARVRNGEITPAELAGGTFTVSNLGMFGMTAITPVINPPQAAILGVGTMRETLRRVNGQIIDHTLLTLTLSCDHRILYGADAARFLAHIRELLEHPLKLVI